MVRCDSSRSSPPSSALTARSSTSSRNWRTASIRHALALLLDLIENQVKNKGIQVVATTHSPQLLGHLSPASLEHASLVYRLEHQPDSRIIRILDMPDARRIIENSGAADLATTGWFETTAYFMQPDPDDAKVAPRPARRRKTGASR